MRPSRRPSRAFSAFDLFILMACTAAAGIWLCIFWDFAYVFVMHSRYGSTRHFYLKGLSATTMIADSFLAAWTLAWCIVRLRGPRPRWRLLVREPGMAVGFIATLAWLAGALVRLRWEIYQYPVPCGWLAIGYIQLASSTMLGGFGVFVTWAGSALSGRWRPARSWVDRMGRALGAGWIVLAFPSGLLLQMLTGRFY